MRSNYSHCRPGKTGKTSSGAAGLPGCRFPPPSLRFLNIDAEHHEAGECGVLPLASFLLRPLLMSTETYSDKHTEAMHMEKNSLHGDGPIDLETAGQCDLAALY